MRFFAGLLLIAGCAAGAVKQVYIVDRADVLHGESLGSAGPYERIVAKAHFSVDPNNTANHIITDLDLAPKDDTGLVEFSSDVIVLKPRDPARGNGSILLEISNRGGMGLLRMFDEDTGSSDEYGDRYLLRQGYTLVWVGWQFDVPKDRPLKLYTPVAAKHGQPITGLVRSEFVPESRTSSMPLADRNHVAYLPLDPDDKEARLTVRDTPASPPKPVGRTDWSFDGDRITMAAGFQPGKVYEVVYRSSNPPVAGLGLAAVRDFVSFLKYGGGSPTSVLEQRRYLKRAIGFGTSQSGRFLRTFLYYGFNTDEKDRKVFDGVWAHVAGAGRGSFNIRFAQPSRDGHPLMNLFYPTDLFPFTDLPETDPESGDTAGLLDRTLNTPGAPKIFYTNGSYEYWGRAGSLIHTTADGKKDAPVPPGTRIYFLAGTQHGPNARPVRSHTQNLANPADYRWTMRALLAAFNAWLKDGTTPPDSRYPRIDRNEIAPFEAISFPHIPGVELPRSMYHAMHLDFGPDFAKHGIISIEPPNIGKPFPQLVPRVRMEDGNEMGGIQPVELRVPLATYTGWNLRSADIGAPNMMADMIGSFIPFARTKAERLKTGDPRLSIEERYANRDDFLAKAREAANELVREGFLLKDDVDSVIERARVRWDFVMNWRSEGTGR
jgi:hypothetical protein